jgi:Domain of unknown function (DUF4824)
MTFNLSSRTLFLLATVLILVANVVVLAGVAANRHGEPDARLKLSERELRLPYSLGRDNSGLALQLIWRTLGTDRDDGQSGNWQPPDWLTSGKMMELGFDPLALLAIPASDRHLRRPPSREVFVVLEVDGPLYGEAVRRAEAAAQRQRATILSTHEGKRAQELLEAATKQEKYQHAMESRLFAVDAGNDAKTLRDRYPDRSRFLVTRGIITPQRHQENGRDELTGTISRLSVNFIHVPQQFHPVFNELSSRHQTDNSRLPSLHYTVEIAVGSRLEPWVVAVSTAEEGR